MNYSMPAAWGMFEGFNTCVGEHGGRWLKALWTSFSSQPPLLLIPWWQLAQACSAGGGCPFLVKAHREQFSPPLCSSAPAASLSHLLCLESVIWFPFSVTAAPGLVSCSWASAVRQFERLYVCTNSCWVLKRALHTTFSPLKRTAGQASCMNASF